MKQTCNVVLACVMSIPLLSPSVSTGETTVPCLKFSGNADAEHCLDLSKLNRITFGDDSMTVSSSTDNGQDPVELLYSLYHHLEIGEAAPSISVGIADISSDSDSRLSLNAGTGGLRIVSPSDRPFSVGVFNPDGTLMLKANLYSGETLSTESLTPGVYVAVATDGEIRLNLKFILD